MLNHLIEVYDLTDPNAWASRADALAASDAWADHHGRPRPSSRLVFDALRRAGICEAKRRGIRGFRGIAAWPAIGQPLDIEPHGTRRQYAAGCHCDDCRAAERNYRGMRRVHARMPELLDVPRDPFATWPREPDEPEPLSWGDNYSRDTRIPGPLRKRCERRWGPRHLWTCYVCGNTASTVDHLVAWTESHDSRPANLAPICSTHQLAKGDRDLRVWGPTVGLSTDRIEELLTNQ